MKYFTKEWCFGDLDDEAIENNEKEYGIYIKSIHNKMSFVLRLLSDHINLHDGIIKNVRFCKHDNALILSGIFGDLQVGYFALEIKYLGVSNLRSDDLLDVFSDQKAVILSDEIEWFSGELFAHRMIFSSKKELEVNFYHIELNIKEASGRDYKMQNCELAVQ